MAPSRRRMKKRMSKQSRRVNTKKIKGGADELSVLLKKRNNCAEKAVKAYIWGGKEACSNIDNQIYNTLERNEGYINPSILKNITGSIRDKADQSTDKLLTKLIQTLNNDDTLLNKVAQDKYSKTSSETTDNNSILPVNTDQEISKIEQKTNQEISKIEQPILNKKTYCNEATEQIDTLDTINTNDKNTNYCFKSNNAPDVFLGKYINNNNPNPRRFSFENSHTDPIVNVTRNIFYKTEQPNSSQEFEGGDSFHYSLRRKQSKSRRRKQSKKSKRRRKHSKRRK